MFQGKRIAVVIPAYNEEKLLPRVLETLPDYVDRIYVVDDGSTDNTYALAVEYQQWAALRDRLRVLRHETNRGVGAAIYTGYKSALADDCDIVAVMAGDAQMDPQDLPRLLTPVAAGVADYAKGNRLVTGDAWRTIPRVRYLGNAALSLLTKIASGYWHVADSQCGYTAISSDVLRLLDLDHLYRGYGQPNDLLVHLGILGVRVVDVPVRPVYNIGEKSGIRPLRMIPRLSWLLCRLFFKRLFRKYAVQDFHPLVFFYGAGIALFVLSLLLALRMCWVWGETGLIPRTNALACLIGFTNAIQFTLFAMWFDMVHMRQTARPASELLAASHLTGPCIGNVVANSESSRVSESSPGLAGHPSGTEGVVSRSHRSERT